VISRKIGMAPSGFVIARSATVADMIVSNISLSHGTSDCLSPESPFPFFV